MAGRAYDVLHVRVPRVESNTDLESIPIESRGDSTGDATFPWKPVFSRNLTRVRKNRNFTSP